VKGSRGGEPRAAPGGGEKGRGGGRPTVEGRERRRRTSGIPRKDNGKKAEGVRNRKGLAKGKAAKGSAKGWLSFFRADKLKGEGGRIDQPPNLGKRKRGEGQTKSLTLNKEKRSTKIYFPLLAEKDLAIFSISSGTERGGSEKSSWRWARRRPGEKEGRGDWPPSLLQFIPFMVP